jgi:hypothetical protein
MTTEIIPNTVFKLKNSLLNEHKIPLIVQEFAHLMNSEIAIDILPGLKSESTEAASCFLLKA